MGVTAGWRNGLKPPRNAARVPWINCATASKKRSPLWAAASCLTQANQELRRKLRSGELDAQDYYRQLLRLVYRLIFLFAAEDRDLLLDPQAQMRPLASVICATIPRRACATWQNGSAAGGTADLWQGLLLVTDILGGKLPTNGEVPFTNTHSPLALPVLNGFLFSDKALPDLESQPGG